MDRKVTLSHTTIVKNEQKVIGRCLDSIKGIIDEFIIVDTGSEDNTVKIIEEKVGKCYHTKWTGDYATARNYGVERCTSDWILVQDADEHMTLESAKILKDILAETPENIWEILVIVQDYKDESMIPLYRLYGHRLFRNRKGIKWSGKGHEALTTPLNHRTRNSKIVVMHDKTPNAASPIPPKPNESAQVFVSNFLKSIAKNPKDARSMFYLANTYMGQCRYNEAIQMYHTYLGVSGWNDERYQARLFCARCYKILGELENARKMIIDAYEERDDRNEGDLLLGELAFNEDKYRQALIWFNLAVTKAEKAQKGQWPETLLFLEGNAYTYLPYDWLAWTYWKLGDKVNAKKYTYKALKFLPNGPDHERLKGNLRYYK